MDLKNNQAPNTMAQPRPVSRPTAGGGMGMDMGKTGNSKKMLMIGIVVVVIIVICASMMFWKQMAGDMAIKKSQYQAIFLTNGQVYFGKLANVGDHYVKLSDIYYLQVQQTVQPADNKTNQQPQVSLAKLGSELHGPEDEMQISRDQVLFWENLKDDSKVVKAIQDNQKK